MFGAVKISRWLLLVLVAALPASAQVQETNSQTQQNQQQAQQPDKTFRTPKQEISELEKANLARVAASPAQVREVLIKDPGLLVELKRWVAKETADNGQITDHRRFEPF